jgi:hypothetical protein
LKYAELKATYAKIEQDIEAKEDIETADEPSSDEPAQTNTESPVSDE